jgi:hypothetical protein
MLPRRRRRWAGGQRTWASQTSSSRNPCGRRRKIFINAFPCIHDDQRRKRGLGGQNLGVKILSHLAPPNAIFDLQVFGREIELQNIPLHPTCFTSDSQTSTYFVFNHTVSASMGSTRILTLPFSGDFKRHSRDRFGDVMIVPKVICTSSGEIRR